MWDSQLNYTAERGFRAIAFDRRGFGRSGSTVERLRLRHLCVRHQRPDYHLDLQEVTLVEASPWAAAT